MNAKTVQPVAMFGGVQQGAGGAYRKVMLAKAVVGEMGSPFAPQLQPGTPFFIGHMGFLPVIVHLDEGPPGTVPPMVVTVFTPSMSKIIEVFKLGGAGMGEAAAAVPVFAQPQQAVPTEAQPVPGNLAATAVWRSALWQFYGTSLTTAVLERMGA